MIGSLVGAFGGRALGGMLGGGTGRMVGSLVGSMLGSRGGLGAVTGGLGSVLGGLGGGDDNKQDAPAQIDDDTALVLIRAMTNSAKADGEVTQDEIDAIIQRAGDLDGEEEALLRHELSTPLDLDGLVESVPSGMERDVYIASLLPIEVDTIEERDYLRDLADGLGLREDDVIEIHAALDQR
jgi:uncharacterized membrane protein YebE (DUF533 family)